MRRQPFIRATVVVALLIVLATAPTATAAAGVVVVTTTIQAAVNAASPGDTILVPPGVYPETVTVTKSGLTIKGTRDAVLDAAGFSVGIRASSGPTTIGPDGFPVCPAFGLHDLSIDGLTIRNASFTGVLFRGVERFAIRNGAYTGNEAYAIFPICSRDGIIERNHVEGTTDGAIYVGNSREVVVADNRASASTVGIEIENSIGITVRNNRASGNSAGIAVFSLPGLAVPLTSDVVITGNTVSQNNLPNPIPPGSDPIGSVPTGSGILSIATNDVVIAGNRVNENNSGGIAVIAYPFPFADPRFDPFPDGNEVRGNTVNGNGMAPDIARSPLPGADLLHDGTGSGNCFAGNRFRTSFPAGIEALFPCG
jgi:parallel beta-helix repeat protein